MLAAEQEAQHIVNAARTAKMARLKQAKEEAEKEAKAKATFTCKMRELLVANTATLFNNKPTSLHLNWKRSIIK